MTQNPNPQPLSREERTLKLIGEITPCLDCDGSGVNDYGSCCRIPGHARECKCVLCQWKNACQRNEKELSDAKATCVALEQERDELQSKFNLAASESNRWQGLSEAQDKLIQSLNNQNEALRATIAQYKAALKGARDALDQIVCSVCEYRLGWKGASGTWEPSCAICKPQRSALAAAKSLQGEA